MSRVDSQAGFQHPARGIPFLHSPWDALLIGLSIALNLTLLSFPSAPIIAVAVWWNANTIAHNFIHRPFFRSVAWNRAYSAYLSLLLGFPQSWWRDRHLAHHAGQPIRVRFHTQLVAESLLVGGLWGALIFNSGGFFWTAYLPGFLAGLGLCWLHGYFEHAGGTVSHYSVIYNTLFLNDGYHVEHHREPSAHWTDLPNRQDAGTRSSRWPAVLRWLEMADRNVIDALERLALSSETLQHLLLRSHEAALGELLPHVPEARTITIVGGGMFPRTAILLRRLLPDAAITIVDGDAENITTARRFIDSSIALEHRSFDGKTTLGADLVVIPLSFRGNRRAIYRDPPAACVLVHDWIWRPRGKSAIVSWRLLKRLNLIRGGGP